MSMNIFIGNVGSGKSIIARKLALKDYVVVNMDMIQEMIGGYRYGLYDAKKKEIYQKTEETIIETALKINYSVVIDRTNMDRKRRQRFIEIGKKYTKDIIAYDWGIGEERELERRISEPRGIPSSVWREVYKSMKKNYEPPELNEGFDRIIIPPKKFKFHAFDFDGIIVKNNFPEIGEIINNNVDELNKLWQDLSNIIIIWSCRSGDYEREMRKFLIKNKIPFDFINENPIFDTGSRKIFAHKYYDDRNN